jgi:hypothetical protein
MPTAFVRNIDLETPRDCAKNEPIAGLEVQVVFEVVVDGTGCYAIAVYVYDHENLIPDRVIASNVHQSRIPCYCLQSGNPQRFVISGSVGPTQPDPAGALRLRPPLSGKWPESDGPFDNTLDLYAKVEVYYCLRPCPPQGDCEMIRTQKLDMLVGVGTTEDDDLAKVDIKDGGGVREGIELLKEAAKTGAGAALKTELPQPFGGDAPKSLLPGLEGVYFAGLQQRIDEVRIELARLSRGQASELVRPERHEGREEEQV